MAAMTIEKFFEELPKFTTVIGEEWLLKHSEFIAFFLIPRFVWFRQVDGDLSMLATQYSQRELIRSYRDSLRNKPQIQKTIFEIHGASLLASGASKVRLHVDNEENGRIFDIQIEIGGNPIFADVKTRKDDFPFNLPSDPNGMHAGQRATMDPHDSDSLGM